MEFIQGEERCLKFISQDLTFLQSSSISSTFSNISNTDGASVKIREPHTQTALLCIQLLIHIPQENTEVHLLKLLSQSWVSHWQKYAKHKLNQSSL